MCSKCWRYSRLGVTSPSITILSACEDRPHGDGPLGEDYVNE
jgi:hypothetical protein